MPMQTRRPMPRRDERDEQIDTRARSHALDFMTAATQVLTVMCLVKGNPALNRSNLCGQHKKAPM